MSTFSENDHFSEKSLSDDMVIDGNEIVHEKLNAGDVNDDIKDENNPKHDANDYTRFKDNDDSDSDGEKSSVGDGQIESRSLLDSLQAAVDDKDAGNISFKVSDFSDAKSKYSRGILALKPHKDKIPPDVSDSERKEILSLLISLHGNMAMVQLKLEDWSSAVKSASEVLKVEPANVKALFRRGIGYSRLGLLDESKADLLKTVELDPGNIQAKKELVEVNKSLKELAKKEKAAFSSLFSKKSMYDDKEKEREEKKRKEERENERLHDEWTKSKLSRRENGLDEQTFDEWKSEKDKALKAAEEEKKKREKTKQVSPSKIPPPIKPAKPSDDDQEDYDEEESKIISETAKKGYCYFNRKPSEQEKSLIGDISPKTVHKVVEDTVGASNGSAKQSVPMEIDGQPAPAVSASSWNHAGTWEERDLTKAAHDRFTVLCMEVEAQVQDADRTVCIKMVKVDKIEGDAQIILARNKKRHIFDLTAKLEFEVTIETAAPTDISTERAPGALEPKVKKYSGFIEYADITPGSSIDGKISFKREVSSAYSACVQSAVTQFKQQIQDKIERFETDFKSF